MIGFNRERVLVNARKATTEDLLDRVTAFRAGMEPEALDIIESELRSRGVTSEAIEAHAERHRRTALFQADGVAARCSLCDRPAVAEAWGWHRFWRVLPIFPRLYRFCDEHCPERLTDRAEP